MKDAQKPDHKNLNGIINWLREGRFVIPDFQREFEWNPWDIRDLMRSIFLDYYIGSLLLWKGKESNFAALSCEPVYGRGEGGSPEYIVLDGQQRLTAIHYAFLAPDVPLPNRTKRATYYINVDRFMAEDYDESFDYQFVGKRTTPIFFELTEKQYEQHLFPLHVIGQTGWALPNWVQGYERYWRNKANDLRAADDENSAQLAEEHANNAITFGEHLKSITEDYQISYIELDRDLQLDKVCDIFTQINSRGVRLDVFDLINALLKPKGLQLKHMWREAQSRLEFVDSEKMNVYILQVMSIMRQAYCSPKYLYFLLPGEQKPVRRPDGTRSREILVPDGDNFNALWHRAVDALEHAINLLRHPQEFGVVSSSYLPYVAILPVFAAIEAHVKTLPPERRLDAQRKVRHWYWSSVFTNRYSGSVESTSARDYLDVLAWLDDDAAEPALLKEFEARFKSLDLRNQARNSSSIYKGIFNVLVLQGARDWINGTIPQHGDLDDHHIIPSSWGKANLSGNGTSINTILNRTPLTAATNRQVIGKRLPNEYLPELITANGEETVRSILTSHFISPAATDILLRNPFTEEDYEQFVTERQRTILQAIEQLLIKERLDLSPQLRELDESVELIELALRDLVDVTLDGDIKLIPGQFAPKVEDRIQKALRKNAALDPEQYQTLTGKLEFFDLRELQDTIINKSLWPRFEPTFKHKQVLLGKFDQLAELRNAIRHSRAVNEVVCKEGEAAILWFKGILEKALA